MRGRQASASVVTRAHVVRSFWLALTAYVVDDAADFVALGQFHTSFNATTVTTGADEKHGAVHTVGLNNIDVFRLGFFADAAAAASVTGVIYQVDGSNNPTNLVAESDEITAVVRGWNEVTFSTPPTLTAGSSYWLGVHVRRPVGVRIGAGAARRGGFRRGGRDGR